jgi:hypothetical protein
MSCSFLAVQTLPPFPSAHLQEARHSAQILMPAPHDLPPKEKQMQQTSKKIHTGQLIGME